MRYPHLDLLINVGAVCSMRSRRQEICEASRQEVLNQTNLKEIISTGGGTLVAAQGNCNWQWALGSAPGAVSSKQQLKAERARPENQSRPRPFLFCFLLLRLPTVHCPLSTVHCLLLSAAASCLPRGWRGRHDPYDLCAALSGRLFCY